MVSAAAVCGQRLPANSSLVPLNTQWNSEADLPESDTLFWKAATIQRYRHAVEYYYDGDSASGYTLRMRELVHKVIRLNTQQGVTAYSQLRIPINGKLVYRDARTWMPGGKHRKLPDDAYYTVEPPNGTKEVIFAFRGAQVGGRVEFIYMIERPAELSGMFVLQSKIPVQDAVFEFITPDYIKLDIMTKRSPQAKMRFDPHLHRNKNTWLIGATNIPPLGDSRTFRRSDPQRICFRIAENKRDRSKVLSWQDIGSRYSEAIYPQLSDEVRERLQAELNEAFTSLGASADQEKKIIALTEHVRSAFRYIPDNHSGAVSRLEHVLNHRVANWQGILRLYGALFWQAGIRHQPVLTSDKRQITMDVNFPSWDFIQRVLFYFPEQKTFFAPLQTEYSYGLLPPETVSNRALFLNPTGTHALFWTNVAVIRQEYQIENRVAATYELELDTESHQVSLQANRTLEGYKAVHSDPKELFGRRVAGHNIPTERARRDIRQITFSERRTSTWTQEQNGAWQSATLLESAGKTLLLRIGDLFQLSTREAPAPALEDAESPIHLDYPEAYQTEVEVRIPEGYLIRNLEDLRKKIVYEKNGYRMGMTCTYDLEAGRVRIRMREFYDQSSYPPALNDTFHRIQSAVWELRNTVLILEAH